MATPAATVHEPARNLPVAGTAEVFVAGGGPAALAARHRCPPHQVPFQDIAPLIDRPPDD